MGKDARLKRERRSLKRYGGAVKTVSENSGLVTEASSASPEWFAEQRAKGNIVYRGQVKTWSIAPGLYTPIQVLECVDEGAMHLWEQIDEWGGGDFTELLQSQQELRDRISDVFGYVRRTPGRLVTAKTTATGATVNTYPFSGEDLRAIAGLTLQLITVVTRMEIDREAVKQIDDTISAGEAVGLGLGFLLSNKDEGETLRAAVDFYTPANTNIRDWIKATKAGRKTRDGWDKEVRSWLHNKLIEAWEGCSREDAYKAVQISLDERADSLEGVELAAHQWITDSKDPCGTLWKSIDRARDKTPVATPVKT